MLEKTVRMGYEWVDLELARDRLPAPMPIEEDVHQTQAIEYRSRTKLDGLLGAEMHEIRILGKLVDCHR